jgi:hypothetical protein
VNSAKQYACLLEGRMADDRPSVDALILSLIAAGRQATDDELQRIVVHIACAPFTTRLVRTTRWLREQLAQQDIIVESQVPSVQVHLLKRVYIERQWPIGTTTADYLDDLHQAVKRHAVRIWTYRYYAEPYIAILAPSHRQDAPSPQPFIFVAYNPRYGVITTGYQASGPEAIFTTGFEQMRQQR